MATDAVARDVVASLRRDIARIEGRLTERLAPAEDVFLRLTGRSEDALKTGDDRFDAALGGGVPLAALTEIHGSQVRDTGVVAGFAFALAGLLLASVPKRHSVLWVAPREMMVEGGMPYLAGLGRLSGIPPGDFLIAQPNRLADALWIADEAAKLSELAAVFLEIHGNPRQFDLTASRRLHRRAQEAGRPVFLLRHAARPQPTAAPLRLVVNAAPSVPRETLAGPLAGSIGRPVFAVRIDKNHAAPPRQFLLEWNRDDRRFRQSGPEDTGALVSASSGGPHNAPSVGAVLAFKPAGGEAVAAHVQPAREQHTAHRSARRAG